MPSVISLTVCLQIFSLHSYTTFSKVSMYYLENCLSSALM